MKLFSFPSKQERFWVLGTILVALFLSSSPYLYGMIRQGHDFRYLWVNPLGPADTNVYFSFIKQAAQGKVFLENLHTSEIQNGSIFHPLWLVLGWVAALFHIAIPVIFHVARVIFGGIFLLLLYRFLLEFFEQPRQRILAFLLLTFSSGLGAFFSLGINVADNTQQFLLLPTDQWVPESNTFLTLLHSPLFILSQTLLLVLAWSFAKEKQYTSYVFFAALVFLLGILHPYDLVTTLMIMVSYFSIRIAQNRTVRSQDVRRYIRRTLLVVLFAVPSALYFILVGRIEPAIGQWAQQNITPSPLPHNYIIGYGLLTPFAVVGFTALRKTRKPVQLLVLTWVVVSILLLYVPVQINRRFTNGLHIPLAILAAVGIDILWNGVAHKLRNRRWTRQVVLATCGWVVGLGLFLSSGVTVARAIYWEANPVNSIYYVPRNVMTAIQWMEKSLPRNAVIISHPFIGNLIPAVTGDRVYAGHGHQTLHWKEKVDLLKNWFFYTNKDDEAKVAFLKRERISFIFFSQYEDVIGSFDPSAKPYLQRVAQFGSAAVYRVLP